MFGGKYMTVDNNDGNDNGKDDDKYKYEDNGKDNDILIEVITTQVWGQTRRRLPGLESPAEGGNPLGQVFLFVF